MSDETEVITEPETIPAEGGEADDVVETKEPESTPEEIEKTAVQKRIDTLTREKYSARRESEQAKAEATQLREAIARVQTEGGEIPDVEQIQTLVRQEAERIATDKSFNDACNATYSKGKEEFEDFDKAVENLQMVGVNREFLEVVSSSDHGAKIIDALGRDLDEASRIASLPPLKMARELIKLEYKLVGQPKGVSKAPTPIAHISGNKAIASKSPEKMNQSEFNAWRQKEIQARNKW